MVKVSRLDSLAAVLGFGLVVSGIAMWSAPAALVMAGVLLLIGAVWRTA